MKLHEDMKEGWSFQGRKRHAPKQKQTSPQQEAHHSSLHISQRETMPGKERDNALRGTPLFFHFPWHPGAAQQGTSQSQGLASSHQGEELEKGDTSALQKSSSAESPILL